MRIRLPPAVATAYPPPMQLSRDGAQHLPAAFQPCLVGEIEQALCSVPDGRPGVRLANTPSLFKMLAATGPIGCLAAAHLGEKVRPVRALFFNKTEDRNWSLGWHQDRTIAVRERVETPGFTNWTIKAGMQHVEPPAHLLEAMLTIRIHLDDVGVANAPLLIAPGSHQGGRIAESMIAATVERLGSHACLAARGDAWLYATLILHASEPARLPRARRVLQVDYSASDLPSCLAWAGI